MIKGLECLKVEITCGEKVVVGYVAQTTENGIWISNKPITPEDIETEFYEEFSSILDQYFSWILITLRILRKEKE